MPAASVSFVHISRVHQVTLDDESLRFYCLTDSSPECDTRRCDVALNLYCSKLKPVRNHYAAIMHQPVTVMLNMYSNACIIKNSLAQLQDYIPNVITFILIYILTWHQWFWLIHMYDSWKRTESKGECGYISKTMSMSGLKHLRM